MKTENNHCKTFRIAFIIATVYLGMCIGQRVDAQTGTVNKDKMERLTIWAGKWIGEGWSIDESREKTAFTIEQHMQLKLDGNLILAEGIGRNKADGKESFSTVGMYYYHNEKKTYEVKNILGDGTMSLSKAQFNDQGQFIMSFDLPGGAKIEYTTTLTETIWKETGAYILPSGQVYPILEMNLKKTQ